MSWPCQSVSRSLITTTGSLIAVAGATVLGPEVDHQTHRGEGIADVAVEVRVEVEPLDIHIVVAGHAAGARVGQAAKVHHARHLPPTPPKLRLGGQYPGVGLAELLGRGMRRQQAGVNRRRDRGGRAVAIEKHAVVFVDNDRVVAAIGRGVARIAPGSPGLGDMWAKSLRRNLVLKRKG